MIFRDEHMEMILRGEKTMTRRRHVHPLKVGKTYRTKKSWTQFRNVWIKIEKVYKQRLGDMTEEDARKEGGYTLEEFKKVWRRINGKWNPDDIVWVYEFKVVNPPTSPRRLNGFLKGKSALEEGVRDLKRFSIEIE